MAHNLAACRKSYVKKFKLQLLIYIYSFDDDNVDVDACT